MSTNMEQSGQWQNMEMERRLDKELIDEFPLGTLSFSVDMDELAAMNNGESGIAPQSSHDDEEFHIDGEKHHNPLISNIHLNNSTMYQSSMAGKPTNGLNLARPRAERKAPVGGKWTQEEDNLLRVIVQEHGPKCWKKVANLLGSTRTDVQCLHRWNKVLKPGLHKGTWTKEEDQVVLDMVMQHGVGKVKWSSIAAKLPGRIGKQCRERWFNHLDPNIKKGEWTNEEELIIFEAQRCFGNRWCEISKLLPGRTENAVKNRWNSCAMKKWLKDRGLEPGPNMNLRNSSKAEMYQAVTNFRRAITNAGVELSAEAIQALSAFNDNDTSDDEYSDASVATTSVRSVRSTRSDTGEGDRDRESMDMFKDDAIMILKSNSSDSVMNSVLNYDIHERASSYNLFRQPIQVKDEPFQSLQPEEYHVVDALHQIKQSPYNDMLSSPSIPVMPVNDNPEPIMLGQHSKRLKLGEENENDDDFERKRQSSPAANANDDILHNALMRTKKLFSSDENGSNNLGESVPLESISFFKYLSEDAQRSILLNLITRFQKVKVNLKSFVLLSSSRFSGLISSEREKESQNNEVPSSASSSEKSRKRTAAQADVGADIPLAEEIAIDAAVKFIQFVANSSLSEVTILIKTLKTNDINELNVLITSILLESRRNSYEN